MIYADDYEDIETLLRKLGIDDNIICHVPIWGRDMTIKDVANTINFVSEVIQYPNDTEKVREVANRYFGD